MSTGDLGDGELTELLQRYLTILQGHPSAEEMMDRILTRDFQTGFVGGHLWKGLDGLRDFLSQRGRGSSTRATSSTSYWGTAMPTA